MSIFTFSKGDDRIGCLTIDVKDESLNTLKAEFIDEVASILDQIEKDRHLIGVILCSGKPDSFIAGADIHMIEQCSSAQEATELSSAGQALFQRIEDLNIPVVAAIHGVCLGGGLELALACHARVCSDDAATQLGLPEVQLGVLPGGGGTQRLPKLVGVAAALDMMLTGKKIRAKRAYKMGLVDDCVALPLLMETAKSWVQKSSAFKRKSKQPRAMQIFESTLWGRKLICKKARQKALEKTKGHYPAPEAIIDCTLAGQKWLRKSDYQAEAQAFGQLVHSPESAALRSIFFATTALKKEEPVKKAKHLALCKTAIVGGGLMGSGIASVTACKAALPVRIKDVRHEGLITALSHHYASLAKKHKRGYISKLEFDRKLSLMSTSLSYEGMHDIDLVVEAVFENLELKHTIIRELEKHTGEHTIIATNTSSIPISDIAAVAQRPTNVIGIHYFSPVEKMPLVEIVPHKKTSASTIATAVDFARKQGKTAIVVQDGAGFYVNRILALYMTEASRLLFEGMAIEDIDQAAIDFGFPLGPFALLDEVGVDVSASIVPMLTEKLGERFHVPQVFDDLLKDKRLGKKVKKGFYSYQGKKGQKKGVDRSVYSALHLSDNTQPLSAEAMERCVLQMLNESALCLEDGVIANARDGDIGAIFGIGFPPFLGGTFRYMDRLGLQHVVQRMDHFSAEYGDRFTPCNLLRDMSKRKKSFYQRN